jgi:hypothetical protein
MRCNFEKLFMYVNNELNHDQKFEVLAHLHQCEICLEAVTLLSEDAHSECFIPDSSNGRACQPDLLRGKGLGSKAVERPSWHPY